MTIRSQLEGKQFSELDPFIDALSAGVNEEIQAAIQPFLDRIDQLEQQVAELGGKVDEIGSRQSTDDTPTPTPVVTPTPTPQSIPGSGTGAVGPTGIIPNLGPDDLSPVGPITVSIPGGASDTPPENPPENRDEFVVGPFPWIWNPDLQRWTRTI